MSKLSLRDRIRQNEFKTKLMFPIAPSKPRLNHKHTAVEAKRYAAKLEAYEKHIVEHKELRKHFNLEEGRLYQLFKEACIEDCGIADHPKADKAFSQAWQKAHSDGYEAVLYELEELSDLLI